MARRGRWGEDAGAGVDTGGMERVPRIADQTLLPNDYSMIERHFRPSSGSDTLQDEHEGLDESDATLKPIHKRNERDYTSCFLWSCIYPVLKLLIRWRGSVLLRKIRSSHPFSMPPPAIHVLRPLPPFDRTSSCSYFVKDEVNLVKLRGLSMAFKTK